MYNRIKADVDRVRKNKETIKVKMKSKSYERGRKERINIENA